MSISSARRGAAATLLTLALAATSVVAAPILAPAVAAAGTPDLAVRGYITETYPSLPENNVFEVVTFERFEYLLNKSGTYAFLVGNAADDKLQAEIAHINSVATGLGVEKIYLFDPKLDGDYVDVRNYVPRTGENATVEGQVEALYTRVLTNNLNKDTSTVFTRTESDPYLFVYDKGHTESIDGVDTEDRIVSALSETRTAAQLAEPGAVDAYKALVSAVFAPVVDEGVAQLDTVSHFTFFTGEYNRRHTTDYTNAATHGGAIFTDETEDDFVVYQLSYPELEYLLETPGDHVILFGGTWCHNTRAVVKQINALAHDNEVPVVYNFDLRIDGTSSNNLHIRDSNSALSYLYGDLVTKYLPNLVTQYKTQNRISFYPGGDRSGTVQSVQRLQVPFLIEYNKDAVKAGEKAPITRGWIKDNGNGTHTEYMSEWWYTQGLRGNAAEGSNTHLNGVAFATEAVAAAGVFFTGYSAEQDAAPTTLGVTTAFADGNTEFTTTVSVGGSTATGADGTVEVFATGTTPTSLGSAPVTNGVAKVSVELGAGSHGYYAVYTPASGAAFRASSSLAASVTVVSGFSVTPVVTGTSVALTATYAVGGGAAEDATGSVEFFRTGEPAVSLGSVDVVNGVAALPASAWSVGTHGVYAVYTPDEAAPYEAATTETVQVTVELPAGAVLTLAPTVTGDLKVGKTLSVGLGANYPGAVGTKYQWLREGKKIAKATKATYVATAADRGKKLSVTVTATREGITKAATKTTPKTAAIGYGVITISTESGARTEPTSTGDSTVGSRLTAVLPDYTTTGLTFSYQWIRDDVAIKGATKSTYVLGAADLGKEIRIKVTASKAGYTSLAVSGVCCDLITEGTLTSRATPTISGTKKVGALLTAKGVKWSTSGVTTRYAWYADGELVQLSASATLKLSWQEKGTQVTVRAIGSKAGYTKAESAFSAETTPIK